MRKIARALLSGLLTFVIAGFLALDVNKRKEMVELSGIEPLTSCVQGRRSPS